MQITAVIFAGGAGKRMHSKEKPKQFLLVHGKPIIVHTLEIFQKHSMIDSVIVVCIREWIEHMRDLVEWYRLDKVACIAPGGATGQLSIRNGLLAACELDIAREGLVLIHDGVRPLVDEKTITRNIEKALETGSAVTCVEAKETVVIVGDDTSVSNVIQRRDSLIARAPQTFNLKAISEAHEKALADGKDDFIDSCTLMHHYGYPINTIMGNNENIKVTTPEDFYMFRAIYDARENEQLG